MKQKTTSPIRKSRNTQREKLLWMTQFAILLALEAIVCFTPLGSLPIGTISATLSHIPVIIAAMLLGPAAGALMGFFFGLFSCLVWTFMPSVPVVAFVFTPFYSLGTVSGSAWSLVICFVPRILLGLCAALLFRALYRLIAGKGTAVLRLGAYTLSAVLASLLHTLLVLGGIYLFFGESYAAALGISFPLLLGALGSVIVTNGLLEAGLAALVGYGVCAPLHKYLFKQKIQ